MAARLSGITISEISRFMKIMGSFFTHNSDAQIIIGTQTNNYIHELYEYAKAKLYVEIKKNAAENGFLYEGVPMIKCGFDGTYIPRSTDYDSNCYIGDLTVDLGTYNDGSKRQVILELCTRVTKSYNSHFNLHILTYAFFVCTQYNLEPILVLLCATSRLFLKNEIRNKKKQLKMVVQK